MVRRPASVFGTESIGRPSTRTRVLVMLIDPASRSTASHLSPASSPRRRPRVSRSLHAPDRRSSETEPTKARASSTVQAAPAPLLVVARPAVASEGVTTHEARLEGPGRRSLENGEGQLDRTRR